MIKGRLVKAFYVMCQTCDNAEILQMGKAGITKDEAAMGLRSKGWGQDRHGWMCPICKARTPNETAD